MKHKNQDLLISILIFLLLVSVTYNLLQDNHITKLNREIEEMEYIQTRLISEIDEIETALEGNADGSHE